MARHTGTAALQAGVVVMLAGCGGTPASSLFPLDAGHRWVYSVQTAWEGGSLPAETSVRVITSEGEERIAGDILAWRRRSADGADWWLRSDASGIYRVAAKSDAEPEAQRDAAPRYVLKAPPAAGTQWQATTVPYLLRRRQTFPPEIRHTHAAVPMNYAIEAVDDTVEVRAGRYTRCLRVAGIASLRLYADAASGWRDIPLSTTEWYCPGPGLVKLVRREATNSAFLLGGTLTMELTTWQ